MTRALLILSCLLLSGLTGCQLKPESDEPLESARKPRYFQSPESAVPRIAAMVREGEWGELAAFYDLTASEIPPHALTSGHYFQRPGQTESQLPPPEGELAQYRRPFHPAFGYAGTVETEEPDLVVVELMLEIDQGAGAPVRRARDTIRMRRYPEGWQIVPDTAR